MPTSIGGKSVLCLKSELHLNQDGITTSLGNATLPVLDFFSQIIDEVRPKLVITTGTAGAVFAEHELGDVMVTRAAQFRTRREFRNEPWANSKFISDWAVGTTYFEKAIEMMQLNADRLVEPNFAPPYDRV